MAQEIAGTTAAGKAYQADRLRAAETACAFMKMVSEASCFESKKLNVRDFTDLLEKQFAEVRREATEEKQ